MGTPEFAVPSLQAIASENSAFELVLVVTGKDKPRKSKHADAEPSPVKIAALALGLPVYEVDDVTDPDFAARLQHTSLMSLLLPLIVFCFPQSMNRQLSAHSIFMPPFSRPIGVRLPSIGPSSREKKKPGSQHFFCSSVLIPAISFFRKKHP